MRFIDEIKRISITDYAQSLGFTVIQKGHSFSLKEHDSVIIDPVKNCFWRNSNGATGSIIDFAIEFGNAKNASEAMSLLKRQYGIESETAKNNRQQKENSQKINKEKDTFANNLQNYLSDPDNKKLRNNPISVCDTPNVLLAIGAKQLPVVMNPNDIDKCLASQTANKNKNTHNLTIDELNSLPELLANPVMIFKDQKTGYITVVSDTTDKNGNPFVIGIELNSRVHNHIVNRVATMHGRERAFENFTARNGAEIQGFIPRNIAFGNLLAINKEKAPHFFRSTGLHLPEGKEIVTFDNTITHTLENVNTSKEEFLKKYFSEQNPRGEDALKNSTLILPPKANENKAVYMYLVHKRGIDIEVFKHLEKRGHIYQDGKKNCVFVGYDTTNEENPVFASLRGTGSTRFMADLSGNDYSQCIYLNGKNANTLVVTESFIDTMSYMTLLKKQGENFRDYDFLALGGVQKTEALYYHIKENPNIKRVILALDNDEAGQNAGEKSYERLVKEGFIGKILMHLPKEGKDWNEALLKGKADNMDIVASRLNSQIDSLKDFTNDFITPPSYEDMTKGVDAIMEQWTSESSETPQEAVKEVLLPKPEER